LGFSLNEHGDVEAVGYPLVELLAAIGLTHARPRRPNRRDKLVYEYAVAGSAQSDRLSVPPSIMRAVLGVAETPFPTRRFRMLLEWPGQENQARAITTVTEETAT
jgi:CRISPR-associated protein Csx14